MSWLRLDTNWCHSEWLIDASPSVKLAWVQFLCHVKAHGEKGVVRAINIKAASRFWMVEESDVEQLLALASDAGAIAIEGSDWVVMNWSEYQNDPTNAKRQAEHRARSKGDDNVTGSNGYITLVTGRNVSNDYGEDGGGEDSTGHDGEDVTRETPPSRLLRGIEIPKYPRLTDTQVGQLVDAFHLDGVDPQWLHTEVLKITNHFTRKPSKANAPDLYATLLNWFGRVDSWPKKPVAPMGVRNVL